MVDTVTTTTTAATMGNDNDDWEVAVDTGEFDKRLEQQEKTRASNQVRFFDCLCLSILKFSVLNRKWHIICTNVTVGTKRSQVREESIAK